MIDREQAVMNILKAGTATRMLADMLMYDYVRNALVDMGIPRYDVAVLFSAAQRFTDKMAKEKKAAWNSNDSKVGLNAQIEEQQHFAVQVFEAGIELANALGTPERMDAFQTDFDLLVSKHLKNE